MPLGTSTVNDYKSVKSDLVSYLKKKINLADQMPIHVARVSDRICLICKVPKGFNTFGDISIYVMRRINSNN